MMKKFLLFKLFFSLFWLQQLPAVSYPEGIVAKKPLSSEEMHYNPMKVFQQWYHEASTSEGDLSASTMVLATSTKMGRPSSRAILIKSVDDQGIAFYGDLRSTKFQQLKANPYASATFYWPSLQKQVIMSGMVVPVSSQIASSYFSTRKKELQAASVVSHQGRPLKDRDELTKTHQDLLKQHATEQIPAPDHWGGYMLIPTRVEFWQAGPNNLHSRVEYVKDNGGWEKLLLHP